MHSSGRFYYTILLVLQKTSVRCKILGLRHLFRSRALKILIRHCCIHEYCSVYLYSFSIVFFLFFSSLVYLNSKKANNNNNDNIIFYYFILSQAYILTDYTVFNLYFSIVCICLSVLYIYVLIYRYCVFFIIFIFRCVNRRKCTLK